MNGGNDERQLQGRKKRRNEGLDGGREKIEFLRIGGTREEEDVCAGKKERKKMDEVKNGARKKVCHCCERKIFQMSTCLFLYLN